MGIRSFEFDICGWFVVDVFWVYFKLNVAYEVISLVEFNMKRDQAVSFLLVLFLLGLTPDAFGASKAIEVDSLLKDFVSLEICESIGSETAFIVLQHYSEHESDLLIFKMLQKTELKSYEYTRMTHYSFMGWTVFIDTNLLCKTCSHLDEESLCLMQGMKTSIHLLSQKMQIQFYCCLMNFLSSRLVNMKFLTLKVLCY